MFRWPAVLALYGVLNAAAYSCLLPLWEGFDEAYHYGYVQFLSTNLRLPVFGQEALSRERAEQRRQLESLPPGEKYAP